MLTALDIAKRGPWIVELDLVDPDQEPHQRSETLICKSYDGTPRGAEQWAADVYDWCEVYVRSVRRAHGQIVDSREHGRLDEPAPASVENRNLSQDWSQS